ncbi:MAG TPA: HAD-IB family hydrolase [Acidimicrobiia bacterium]|nr:HAD-IB family hydrolase [Acidimicrobiia bacterium]
MGTRRDGPTIAAPGSIEAGEPAVAIFDLDRTLLPGSSLALLARRAVASGLVPRRSALRHVLDESLFRVRGSTDAQLRSVSERALGLAAGVRVDELRRHVDAAAADAAGRLRPQARRLLELHRGLGHRCIVLSASPQPLVERIAEHLGVGTAVGTELEVVDGVLTGGTIGGLCYGSGKLHRLQEVVGDAFALTSHAYADSLSDLPVLERADHPVAVAPDAALRAEAERRRWPIVEGRQRPRLRVGGSSLARRIGPPRWSASGRVPLAGR